MKDQNIKTATLDHIGLVAAMCSDLDIANKIDARMGEPDPRRVVRTGTAVVAMILNGLGFTNRRLYLTHQFFHDKPIERLLGLPLTPEDITDNTLGKALDEIAEYGATKLFGEIAYEMALENKLLGEINRLDTTSVYVHGEYTKETQCPMEITYGHSKDHRPDLKQFVLSLVVNGPASIPTWYEALSGNSSDSKSFHETIASVRAFEKQIDISTKGKWIADSKLYVKEKLLKDGGFLWLTRVPETIKEARELLEKADNEMEWDEIMEGYKASACQSNYGGIQQRWLAVYSEQAFKREKVTFENQLNKQEEELKKRLWHIGNEVYRCQQDAERAISGETKKIKYFTVIHAVVEEKRYAKQGRPKEGDIKEVVGYRLQCDFVRNHDSINTMLQKKGRFILATNDMDSNSYSDSQMLIDYKNQQDVERGFRFLKDPWFMVDSVFLKSDSRITALMMVMTLCLLVYNVAQYKLRSALKKESQTLPNQLGKKIQNPTMRWIFQMMEGICLVIFYDGETKQPTKELVSNISEDRLKIIRLFGGSACKIYGLNEN